MLVAPVYLQREFVLFYLNKIDNDYCLPTKTSLLFNIVEFLSAVSFVIKLPQTSINHDAERQAGRLILRSLIGPT